MHSHFIIDHEQMPKDRFGLARRFGPLFRNVRAEFVLPFSRVRGLRYYSSVAASKRHENTGFNTLYSLRENSRLKVQPHPCVPTRV